MSSIKEGLKISLTACTITAFIGVIVCAAVILEEYGNLFLSLGYMLIVFFGLIIFLNWYFDYKK